MVCYVVKGMVFSWMWELDYKESWAPKNWCFWTVVLEKTLESPLDCKKLISILKEISPQYWLEGLMMNWNSNTLATWYEELTYLKRPWCWQRLKAWGEGDDRGWDSWMVSPTQWTWVWVNSSSWWWTGRPGVLQSMGLQRVRHGWATELNSILKWTYLVFLYRLCDTKNLFFIAVRKVDSLTLGKCSDAQKPV